MRKVWRIPLPGDQIPDPVKMFIVFPIPASYFGQIPDPDNTLPDPHSCIWPSAQVSQVTMRSRLTLCLTALKI